MKYLIKTGVKIMSREGAFILCLGIVCIAALFLMIATTFGKLNEERCKQMPFSEMIKHTECDKYWKTNE